MSSALEVIAEEISQILFRQVQSPVDTQSRGLGVADRLERRLAPEVVSKLRGDTSEEGNNLYQELDARLHSLEARMTLIPQLSTPPEEKEAGSETSFPNLKYAKSKYKDMEAVLKYVEQDQEKGGVKLVIMNFND